jgi:hypothetical protein
MVFGRSQRNHEIVSSIHMINIIYGYWWWAKEVFVRFLYCPMAFSSLLCTLEGSHDMQLCSTWGQWIIYVKLFCIFTIASLLYLLSHSVIYVGMDSWVVYYMLDFNSTVLNFWVKSFQFWPLRPCPWTPGLFWGVVEDLPSKYKVLSSNPGNTRKKILCFNDTYPTVCVCAWVCVCVCVCVCESERVRERDSLSSDITRSPRLILHVSGLCPQISHLFKKSFLLYH